MTQFRDLEAIANAQGTNLGISDWHLISQTDVDIFADATDAHEWIHVDLERAQRESPFGRTVAHGYLTMSLATPFVTQLLAVDGPMLGINYGLNRVRFPTSVPVGARVRARGMLKSAQQVGRTYARPSSSSTRPRGLTVLLVSLKSCRCFCRQVDECRRSRARSTNQQIRSRQRDRIGSDGQTAVTRMRYWAFEPAQNAAPERRPSPLHEQRRATSTRSMVRKRPRRRAVRGPLTRCRVRPQHLRFKTEILGT